VTARRYLEEFGVRIANNGYEVIPIIPGEKRPYGKSWQVYDGTAEGVEDWIKSGKGSFGVGIKAKHTPAVDVDVHDPIMVVKIKKFVFELVGETLQRVGLPPKTLLPYQTEEPFPKVDTGFWVDPSGNTVKVEILGDGQQFVAAHIHPDTGKAYQWLGKSILNVKRDDLPILTKDHAEAIKQFALQTFLDAGYQKKTKALQRLSATGLDPDDPFAAVRQKTDISDDQLFAKLMLVPSNEDYEMWFHVGMALYHQYDGQQYGLDLWHQWSATAPNYDSDALDKKWPTFAISGKDRPPITARFIIKQAQEEETRINEEVLEKVLLGVGEANDLKALKDICETIKATPFDMVVREMIVGKVKDRFKKITGSLPRIGVIRDMTRYESPENRAMPGWLKNWVYCQHDKTFFNLVDRRVLDRESFDASHARLMLTPSERNEGKSVPETSAFAAAMNLYQVPVVYNRMYMPGMDPLYKLNDIAYVNTYTDIGIPELPGELSPVEEQAIGIFLYHFEHLIADERDRRIMLDFITHVVQNPGSRINWAILIQGTEGDGKSYFSYILKAVLGESNVNVIAGSALEEKYNPWAEGALICFVEDVRLHGANRFDAVNKLKPMITNATASIRRMNTNIYEVVNTMSYIATANIKDALPVGAEDTRFFPVFSRFQSEPAIDAFKAANPDYYTRLFSTSNFAGAIRKFLLERTISDDFNAKARAPKSSYRSEMVALNKSAEEQALQDCLEESTDPAFSAILLDSGLIAEAFMDKDALPPQTKALSRLLSTQGFTYLGRFRMEGTKDKRQFWSKHPEVWSRDEDQRRDEIAEYLDPNGL
jgi:hypothetical protein